MEDNHTKQETWQHKITLELIKEDSWKIVLGVIGTVIYAMGVNLFIVPNHLYTGGVMGICQVIRTLLTEYAHLNFGNIDIAGIIYYLINIPVFLVAMKRIGRRFFVKTVIFVTTMTVALSVVPIPQNPVMGEDILAAALIGGLMCGLGVGLTLIVGGSDGGMDIIGILLIQWRKNFSVGKVGLLVNLVLYSICLFLFSVPTVIYSLIYAALYSFALDHIHEQNIDVEVKIITRMDSPELEHAILNKMQRGITKWESTGVYTGQNSHVLYILLSKYELNHLRTIVRTYDPEAFIVVNEGVNVQGHYLKKL